MREIDERVVREAIRQESRAAPSLVLAREQHMHLFRALLKCGLNVQTLPSDDQPDSVFVEDTAIVVAKTALVTRPGAISRRAETKRVMEALLMPSYELDVRSMSEEDENATLDGGDCLFTGKEFFVGIGKRTSKQGAQVLQRAFPSIPVSMVNISDIEGLLHLKSVCSLAAPGKILFGGDRGEALQAKVEKIANFKNYDNVLISDEAAANAIMINSHLIRREDEEFPRSADALKALEEKTGIQHIPVRGDELAKVDGALTCCCLLF
jgi:dimethylargininase